MSGGEVRDCDNGAKTMNGVECRGAKDLYLPNLDRRWFRGSCEKLQLILTHDEFRTTVPIYPRTYCAASVVPGHVSSSIYPFVTSDRSCVLFGGRPRTV